VSGHGHHPAPRSAVEARVEAIEALLIERGVITSDVVDAIVETYERDLGPMNGARVVARAWVDPDYRARLLADGTRAIGELGFGGAEGEHIVVLENTPEVHNVVVCTLCSCYPWPVLGLPPRWYKSFAYRSRVVREPRAVLAEFGTTIRDDIELRVWDSSAEVRYMVLPLAPRDAATMSEDERVAAVTRDHMIGVAR
jgi:nitrile hydratase